MPRWPERLSQARLDPWARAAVLAYAAASVVAISGLVWRLAVPAVWDELGLFNLLADLRQGAPLPWALGRGALHLSLLRAALALPGLGVLALRVVPLALLGGEAWLLWRRARCWGGPPAAAAAVALDVLSRFGLLRAHTAFGYGSAGLMLLLALELADAARGPWVSLLGGLLAGLLLTDYEPLLVALPVAAWLAWRRPGGGGGRFLVGLAASVTLRVALSAGTWDAFWAVRSAGLGPGALGWREGWANLGGFFFGTKPLQDLGAGAAFPWACLLLLGLGWKRLPSAWKALLLLGLLPQLLASPGAVEVNRSVAAWPALCLGAGLGMERLWIALQGRRPLRILLLAAGLTWLAQQAGAFRHYRAAAEPAAYDYGESLLRAARAADRAVAAGRASGVLSAVSFRSQGAFELLQRDPGRPDRPGAWVLLSREQVGLRPPAAWGRWLGLGLRPGLNRLWLLQPAPGTEALWRRRDADLRAFVARMDGLGAPGSLPALEAQLRGGVADPLERQAMMDRAVWAAWDLHAWPRSLLAWMAAQPDLNSRQCMAVAQAEAGVDPRLALRLARRAVRLQPDSPWPRRLAADLASRPVGP